MKDLNPESQYAVVCKKHGPQGMDYKAYMEQLSKAGDVWKCPICGDPAMFDEDRYENPPSDLFTDA
jgi:rubrerythrin